MNAATDVEGIFRLSGSAKRIKELQAIFDSPDRYGKGLDWTGYTVHDAANIFRRYINQLPQPIVPLEFYEKFREPLRNHLSQAVGDVEAQAQDIGNFDHDEAIATYQRLITELPPLNRQLLLYILDLLAVFASKSDVNLMTSANLAAIFQPGLLSHPSHDMSPENYRLSQDVLIFLVDNQDSFLFGMSGTAADENTVREVQNASQQRTPSTPTKAVFAGLGRSASNASAGTDGSRKLGGLRRNLSVSSKNSRHSSNAGPTTPSSGGASASVSGGVFRSNTVPSKKSPALSSSRFGRGTNSPQNPAGLSPGLLSPSAPSSSPTIKAAGSPAARASPPVGGPSTPSVQPATPPSGQPQKDVALYEVPPKKEQSKELLAPAGSITRQSSSGEPAHAPGPPPKVRKVSGFLSKSPSSDGERREPRQPNKLKKKRIPSSTHPSANSSTHSLQMQQESPSNAAFYTPAMTPAAITQNQSEYISTVPSSSTATNATQPDKVADAGDGTGEINRPDHLESTQQPSDSTPKPKSPTASARSNPSVTDLSELDQADTTKSSKAPKKGRWRFSYSSKKPANAPAPGSPTSGHVGSQAIAERSASSVGSWNKSRKSVSNDPMTSTTEPTLAGPTQAISTSSEQELPKEKEESHESGERKGFLGKIRAKVHQAREDWKEREVERERAKSPPRGSERSGSKQSLSAIVQDFSHRGRSMEVSREQAHEPPNQEEHPTKQTIEQQGTEQDTKVESEPTVAGEQPRVEEEGEEPKPQELVMQEQISRNSQEEKDKEPVVPSTSAT